MSNIHPITPAEVEDSLPPIPEGVYRAFNELIAKHYYNGSAVVKQCDVVELICSYQDVSRQT